MVKTVRDAARARVVRPPRAAAVPRAMVEKLAKWLALRPLPAALVRQLPVGQLVVDRYGAEWRVDGVEIGKTGARNPKFRAERAGHTVMLAAFLQAHTPIFLPDTAQRAMFELPETGQ